VGSVMKRQVRIARSRQLQGALQGQLPGRAVEKVGAAHHMGHALQRIVHYHRELVSKRAVAAPDDDIPASRK